MVNQTGVEIERRFLVQQTNRTKPPDHLIKTELRIEQGYISVGGDVVSRIRHTVDPHYGPTYIYTIKSGKGRQRYEEEQEVANHQLGASLLANCQWRIKKRRVVTTDGWEIDYFEGPLQELILAEKELDHPDQPVTKPDYIAKWVEVTDSITNLHLAQFAATINHLDQPLILHQMILPKKTKRVVLTGGPCCGKSELMKIIRQHYGGKVHCVPEVATILINQVGVKPSKDDYLNGHFQRAIAAIQRQFENVSDTVACIDGVDLMVTDRGVLDIGGYLSDPLLAMTVLNTQHDRELNRYDAVIQLQVAPENIYNERRADNPARSESHQQAVDIEHDLKLMYDRHRHYHFIDNEGGWDAKVERVLNTLEQFMAT